MYADAGATGWRDKKSSMPVKELFKLNLRVCRDREREARDSIMVILTTTDPLIDSF